MSSRAQSRDLDLDSTRSLDCARDDKIKLLQTLIKLYNATALDHNKEETGFK